MSPATHPVAEHEAALAQLKDNVDDHETRLREIERISAGREVQITTLYTTLGEIKQMIADIRGEIAELKAKPANRWEALVGYLIAAAVGALAGVVAKGGV